MMGSIERLTRLFGEIDSDVLIASTVPAHCGIFSNTLIGDHGPLHSDVHRHAIYFAKPQGRASQDGRHRSRLE